MNKVMKKLACIALAGTMGLTSLAGCGDKGVDGTKALVTGGEDTVTVGTANLMLRINQATMLSYYAMFGGNAAGMWDKDMGDGKTYAESAKESVVENCKDMLLLKQHADEYKVSVSEDEQKKIEKAAADFMKANKKEVTEKLAVTQEDVQQYLLLNTYKAKMYDPMTADVDTNVEDAEAAQSALTQVKISIADVQNQDGTTTPLTDEEKKEKKEQAQAVLDKLQASDNAAEADMDAIAKEVEEGLSASELIFGKDETMDEKLKEAAKTLKDGQVYEEVIEGEDAYFVVRMDKVLDREATDNKKETIVNGRKQDAYAKLLEKWNKEADFKVDNKEWEKVTLTDNDQYTIKQPETTDTNK